MEDMESFDETNFLMESVEATEESCEPVVLKKPKVTKDWEEEEVFKLIALVEAEKCLWDASDEAYHNKLLRDRAWRNIGEHFSFKFSATDLNAKWTNLFIQFRGYNGKAKTKSGQGVVETPKWRYYNAMSFVGRAEDRQRQQSVSNLMFCVEEENNSSKSSEADAQTAYKTRKQQVAPAQSAATQIAETMREAVNAMKKRNNSVLDPDTNFATYIVSELKTITAKSAAAIRRKATVYFLECLEEERMKGSNVSCVT